MDSKPKLKNTSVAQKVIIFMTLIMLTINSVTMVVIQNIMEESLIEIEHKYLSEIVKNISNTSELTVMQYVAVCDSLAQNSDFIQILLESDQYNPMQDNPLARTVANDMNDVMTSYGDKIMSMAIFDIEQDAYLLNTGVASGDDFSFKDRPYYAPVYTKKYVVTEPYLDILTNGLVVTIATPIFNEEEVLGVVGLDLPIDFISTLVIDSSYGSTGRSLVLDETNKIIAYSDPSYINSNYSELNLVGEQLERELLSPTGKLVEYDMMGETRLGMVSRIDSLGWIVLTAMDYAEFDQISYIIVLLMVLSVMISVVICGLLISGKLSKELIQLHYKDSLTGLLNRAGFSTRVEELMRLTPTSIGVISININGLKHINDASGMLSGDEHIKTTTARLIDHFGYEFFRMSGDELVAIAPEIEQDKFEQKVNQMHRAMKVTSNYDFSFGHAWGQGGYNVWKLMQEAENIMIINKQEYYANSGKSFDSGDNSLLSNLMSYIADGEFLVYLQPQVHLKNSTIYGAEALIRRFDKKNEKMVFPDQFISLYEKNSIIRHVDMYVVEEVCKLLQSWDKLWKAIPISVNLSRVTLQEYGIVDSIVTMCDKYNIPHKYLVIEVTERVGLVENNVASSLIQQFKNHGFHISLDDFGCAYSNIVTLAQIEVDEVKIDKSLVDDLTISKKNHVLVKNVLSMCNELENTTTLAEGIETIEQAELLLDLGCKLGQGYYYSRPIPVEDFISKYM